MGKQWKEWLTFFLAAGCTGWLQNHSSKASVLWHLAFFMVQLSHPYMTTRKTIALTRWTFVSKVMSLRFNMLSRLVIAFLPRSKSLLIAWLQSPLDKSFLGQWSQMNKLFYPNFCFIPWFRIQFHIYYSNSCLFLLVSSCVLFECRSFPPGDPTYLLPGYIVI